MLTKKKPGPLRDPASQSRNWEATLGVPDRGAWLREIDHIHRDSSQLPVVGAIGHDWVDTAILLAANVGRNVGTL